MKSLFHPVFAICLSLAASSQHQSPLDSPLVGGTLPYSITFREVSLAPAPLPGIHSVAAAK